MSGHTCPCCNTELKGRDIMGHGFPFSDGTTCEHCGAFCETDWDEGWDSYYWWTTGEFTPSSENSS